MPRERRHSDDARARHAPRRQAHLLATIEELSTPVTVDRVVDAVADRRVADCPPRSWHDLHEELSLVDLPALDAADEIEFDDERGIVDG